MDEEEDSRFQLGQSMQKGEQGPKVVHGNVLDELYNEANENLVLKPGQSTNPGSYQVRNRLLTAASEIQVDTKNTQID